MNKYDSELREVRNDAYAAAYAAADAAYAADARAAAYAAYAAADAAAAYAADAAADAAAYAEELEYQINKVLELLWNLHYYYLL